MGCSTSKLDDLPAVSLCRERCNFLEDALHHSYALADAHVAYVNSLKTLGPSLHRFFDQNLNHPSDHPSNGDPHPPPKSAAPPDHSPSSSNSDSHIQFDTDSDDEDRTNYPNHETLNDNFMSSYYTKNQPTQSISYTYPNHNNYQSSYDYHGGFTDSSASKTSPPPAPSSSSWDFLNFFDTYEKYDLPYTVIVAKELKDKEEVHDVEEEPVKENNAKKSADNGGDSVDKNVNSEKESVESKNQSDKRGVSDVMKEVEALFYKASDSGNEVLKMFDAGKFRYHHKNSVYQVSSKMLHVVTPSSSTEKIGSFDEDVIVNVKNLSTTLKKLCMWEKKLYDEVKAEEKLRKIHARKYRQMKTFDEKGAEARKLDTVRTLVGTLSTKMKIAIQVIDKISITINKLRDEELWPQINDSINRLLGMWKAMLECHRCQSRAVVEAKNLDAAASTGKLNDGHLEAAIQLKLELQSWNLSFSNWIDAQKGYVRALNGWLLKCLLYEPEETPDGIAAFSPGSIGAPPVFVLCYQWSQAMDRISEKEVIESMHGFFTSVNQLLQQHNLDQQQRVAADKNMERRVKILEREEQKMQKLRQAREKKTGEENGLLLPGESVHRSGVTNTSSLHLGLNQIFMSMERLAANYMQAYEELHACIEEGSLAQKNPEGP